MCVWGGGADSPSPPHMWNKFGQVLQLNNRVLLPNKPFEYSSVSRAAEQCRACLCPRNCLILFSVQVLLVCGELLVLHASGFLPYLG